MKNLAAMLAGVAAVWMLVGCRQPPTGRLHDTIGPDYNRALPAGQTALRKLTDPNDVPDFTVACVNRADLRAAVARSLNYLAKPSSRQYFPYEEITHDRAVASLRAFDALLAADLSPAQMNQAIRRQFDVYVSVGWDGHGTVLYTGYYTPIFDASPVRTERFQYPLYRPPANLVKGPDGEILGLRAADGTLGPCPPRREIEASDLLLGSELVWLGDAFEAYVAHVQGSAKLRMRGGELVTVGYAASNGHEYKSVAAELIAEGQIPARDFNLNAMIDYFRRNPHKLDEYLWRNPRYVFFAETLRGPVGSLNELVTPMRTIATDKAVYPRACLALIQARLPRRLAQTIEELPYSGFALDQDTGGAIRAPGRCDVYMGVGDRAGELAGRTQREGRLYYLFLKAGPEEGLPLERGARPE